MKTKSILLVCLLLVVSLGFSQDITLLFGCNGEGTSISTSASPDTDFQWQVKLKDNPEFVNLSDVMIWYSGTETFTLHIDPITIPMDEAWYRCELTSSQGTTYSDTTEIRVSVSPEILGATVTPDSYCIGYTDSLVFTAEFENILGQGDTVRWYNGDLEIGTGLSFILNDVPEETTEFNVKYFNACGVSDPKYVTVTVSDEIESTISFPNQETSFCIDTVPGTAVLFETQNPPNGSFIITPSGLELNNNETGINLNQSEPGEYTIIYEGEGECTTPSDPLVINLDTILDATFKYEDDEYIIGYGVTATIKQEYEGNIGALTSSSSSGDTLVIGSNGDIDIDSQKEGEYVITNTRTNGGCPSSKEFPLKIVGVYNFNMTQSATEFCINSKPDSLVFTINWEEPLPLDLTVVWRVIINGITVYTKVADSLTLYKDDGIQDESFSVSATKVNTSEVGEIKVGQLPEGIISFNSTASSLCYNEIDDNIKLTAFPINNATNEEKFIFSFGSIEQESTNNMLTLTEDFKPVVGANTYSVERISDLCNGEFSNIETQDILVDSTWITTNLLPTINDCKNSEIELSIIADNKFGNLEYNWFHKDNQVGTDSPKYTISNLTHQNDGKYYCKVNSDLCNDPEKNGTKSVETKIFTKYVYFNIEVKGEDNDKLPNLLFCTTPGLKYQWYSISNDDSIPIPNATKQYYYPDTSFVLGQTYRLIVKDTNSYFKCSDFKDFTIKGLGKAVTYMNAFPNPSEGEFMLKFDTDDFMEVEGIITVWNMAGIKVKEVNKMLHNDSFKISGLEIGLYYIIFIDYESGNKQTVKVIVN